MTRGRHEPLVKLLLDKIEFNTDTGCWDWKACRNPGGYGVFRSGGYGLAHRAMYETLSRPIPKGMHLDHLCMRRHCVNPDHLEPVTQAENNRRAWAQSTHCPQGHEKTPDNTMVRKNGRRECAECNRIRGRKNRKVTA